MLKPALESLDIIEWLRRYRAYFANRYPEVDVVVVNECAEDAANRGLCGQYPDDPEEAVEEEVASWTPH